MIKHANLICSIIIMVSFSVLALAQTPAEKPDDCSQLPAIKKQLDSTKAKLADWPQFNRYREANSKLSTPTKDEKRIVFMGDSITDLWPLDQFFAGKPYVNRGISGQITSQMLVRFWPDVINLNPKVVVILAGINDIGGNHGPITLGMIEDNLAAMADIAHAHQIRVVFASVLPISDEINKTIEKLAINPNKERPQEQIKQLNEWIKSYCATNGCIYLDYFSALVDEKGAMGKTPQTSQMSHRKDN